MYPDAFLSYTSSKIQKMKIILKIKDNNIYTNCIFKKRSNKNPDAFFNISKGYQNKKDNLLTLLSKN